MSESYPKYISRSKLEKDLKPLKNACWINNNDIITVECGDGHYDVLNFIGDEDGNELSRFGGYIDNVVIVKIYKDNLKKGQKIFLYQKDGDRIIGKSNEFVYH